MTLPLTQLPVPVATDAVSHTPGPWTATHNNELNCWQVEEPYDGIHCPVLFEGCKGDAVLIAAAPDLLACLTETMQYLDSGDYCENETQRNLFMRCVATISKATKGES